MRGRALQWCCEMGQEMVGMGCNVVVIGSTVCCTALPVSVLVLAEGCGIGEKSTVDRSQAVCSEALGVSCVWK